MKQVTEILTREVYTVCPYCSHENDGWCLDPRGKEDECDNCGKKYKVNPDADIEYL